MAISLPQRIKFQNARLQTCSWCLHIIVGTIIVVQFWYLGRYRELVPLPGEVKIQPDYTKIVSQSSVPGGPQSACDSPQLFDYWRDAKGVHRYDKHSCIPICVLGDSDPCVQAANVVFSQNSGTLFVATQVQDKNGLNGTAQNYFMSSAEAVGMSLIVEYGWPDVTWFGSRSWVSSWDWHSSSRDATIHVLNKDMRPVKSFTPGSDITLSVSEMMNLAGVGSLDIVAPLAGVNRMPTAPTLVAAGPTHRIAGMQLEVQVQCGNFSRQHDHCHLQVLVQPGTWVSDATFCNLFIGNNTYRTCRGIRIKASLRGARAILDVNALFINICSSVVFFRLPRAIILVTALYLCGHVSTVYRNVVHRRFSITKEAGAMAMRLLQHEVIFNELQSANNNQVVTKAAIARSLHHILESGECLDSVEVQQMTDFALTEVTRNFDDGREKDDGGLYQAVSTAAFEGLSSAWKNFKESLGILQLNTDHGDFNIDVDKFTAACTSSEPISFKNLVKLFDVDRRVWFLERFFMPMHFKASLSEIRSVSIKASNADESNDGTGHSSMDVFAPRDSMSSKRLEAAKGGPNGLQEVWKDCTETDIMTEQIKVLTLRLDEQQREHEFEKLHTRREIEELKQQMTQIVQAFGSLQLLGSQALEKEYTESSSTLMPCIQHSGQKREQQSPDHQRITGDAQSEQQTEAKDPVLPSVKDTTADCDEMKITVAASTRLCKPHSLDEGFNQRPLRVRPIVRGQESNLDTEATSLEILRRLDLGRHQNMNREQGEVHSRLHPTDAHPEMTTQYHDRNQWASPLPASTRFGRCAEH